MNINYKQKALKYKTKYLELKKQLEKLNIQNGGEGPEWYPQFEIELREIFNNVNGTYGNVVLTGSGVIAYLLAELEMYEDFENFKPGDLDFLYKARVSEPNPMNFGDYKITKGQERASSVTFSLEDKNSPRYVKSFDISKAHPNLKSFNFKGIEIIDLNRLKGDYIPSFETPEDRKDADENKMKLIDKIIKKIGEQGRLNEFGLDDNVTIRDSKRKTSQLFGYESDDNSDDNTDDNTDDFMNKNLTFNFNSPKKQGKLFGDDTDN